MSRIKKIVFAAALLLGSFMVLNAGAKDAEAGHGYYRSYGYSYGYNRCYRPYYPVYRCYRPTYCVPSYGYGYGGCYW